MRSLRPGPWCALALSLATACADGDPGPWLAEKIDFRAVNAPLPQAYCTANVEGKGQRDTETDYIPHVIQCENGGANLQALKAQAIAARSVLYYNMATSGSICDGQGCQVYSCGAQPTAIHYQAAKETAGQYLSNNGLLTYGFYVDGDHTPDPGTCKGDPGGPNEKYVTYNEGKTGANVKQTPLGYIGPPGFGQNRGCMGQWGMRCLDNTKGKGYVDILKFYYGADIKILTAPGNCTGCEPGCDGSKIISADCGQGDCAAFGSDCVDDELGPRCVFFACPAKGQTKVCVDDKIIGDCNDGQISTGDCSAFASYCSTKVGDEARCISVFCASPQETPVPHEGCFLDGQPYACDELGGIKSDPCPAGQKCSVYPDLHCEADLGCPAEGEATVCLDDTVLGKCYGGGVPSTVDCGVKDSYCSEIAGVATCVPQVCLASPDDAPSDHDVCLLDGTIGHCFADGTLAASDCPPGLVCVAQGELAFCADPPTTTGEPTTAGTGDPDLTTGTTETTATTTTTGGGPTPTEAGGSTGATTTPADTTPGDETDEGCGCQTTTPPAAGGLALLLLAALRRRRPSTTTRGTAP